MLTVYFVTEDGTFDLHNGDDLLLVGKGAPSLDTSSPGLGGQPFGPIPTGNGSYNGSSCIVQHRRNQGNPIGTIYVFGVGNIATNEPLKSGTQLSSVSLFDAPATLFYENGVGYRRYTAQM